MSETQQMDKSRIVVHTATIDVKVMRFSNKQMTLSVFRQLPEVPIFLIDGNSYKLHLRGTPWGRVNYLWKDICSWASYHLVWSDGGYLYRCAMPSVHQMYDVCCAVEYDDFMRWDPIPVMTKTEREISEFRDSQVDEVASYLRTFEALDQLFIAV